MENVEQKINNYFDFTIKALNNLDRKSMVKFIEFLLEAYEKEGTIFVFGNGGSGATASHFAGDFVKGASCGLDKRFKVICLNDNMPVLTAIANDISYDDVFVEQLKNFIKKNDLVIGISGSGNSMNVVKAIKYASNVGVKTVAFCGFNGGKVKEISDLTIHADINDMEISEDIHLVIIHCVKKIIIEKLKNKNKVKD